jgi:thioredoxin reductase (NADPH)
MAKPVILSVDDDPQVLRAVERDLRRKYAGDYRILRADSGAAALEIVRELKVRGNTIALFLVDQRMPGMSGVQFLEQAIKLFPDGKRVLLTAYSDTDAAIAAINEAGIHHYLLKPWDPREENLFPVLDDLLEEWLADFTPEFDGIRVLGNRWSPASFNIKDFLARNHVPYRWLDIENAATDPEVATLEPLLTDDEKRGLPLLIFPNGDRLLQPSIAEVASHAGLRTRATEEFYDLAIVGGGPSGLAAAVYAASEGVRTVMIEREAPGGQAGMSSRIENYLGFPSGLSGADLARRAVVQARRFGVEILSAEATSVRLDGPYRFLKLADGAEISCHALLVATGVQWRKLSAPGIERLTGAGVYYGAAMTEAMACKDEDVYIVGGANSAGQAAMFFSRYARRVVMLVRAPSLAASMSQYLINQLSKLGNIEIRLNTEVVDLESDGHLSGLMVESNGSLARLPVAALFVCIGGVPRTKGVSRAGVALDVAGYVRTGVQVVESADALRGWGLSRQPLFLETNLPGMFAAGDVRSGSIKRCAAAIGEGSMSVALVHQRLAEIGDEEMAPPSP